MKTTLMITTKSLLDLLNSYKNWSDYRISKELGTRTQTVSNWRARGTVMGDQYVEKVAKILGFDPDWLKIHIDAERNIKKPFYPKLVKMIEKETPEEFAKKVQNLSKNSKS